MAQGKTAIAIDAIINQKGQGVICVYVAIGQKSSNVARLVKNSRRSWRDGVYDCCRSNCSRQRSAAVSGALRPVRRSPSTSCTVAAIRYVSTTTCQNMPRHTGPCRSCSAARRDAKPILATCFICTPRLLERAAKLSDEKRRRFDDGVAHHRNIGRRRFRLYSDKRNFDHRWTDLSGNRIVPRWDQTGYQRRYFGITRRWFGADQSN